MKFVEIMIPGGRVGPQGRGLEFFIEIREKSFSKKVVTCVVCGSILRYCRLKFVQIRSSWLGLAISGGDGRIFTYIFNKTVQP